MAMKEVQYINNYPICDAEARNQLANKEDKGHKHEEYATSTEVQQIFNSIDINDFDMSDFATKEDVEDAVANIEIPEVDLSDYATKNYVAEQIANADPDIDLSNYALKTDIPTKVSQLENDANYVTSSVMEEYIKDINLEEYQTKNDSNLQTESKTIVEAINELLMMLNEINNKLEETPEEIPTIDFIVNGLDSANSITLVLNNSNSEAVGYIYGTYTPIDSTDKITVLSNAPSIVSTKISKQESGDFTIEIVGHAVGNAQLTLTMGNITKIITVRVISNSENEEELISNIEDVICGYNHIYMINKLDDRVYTCGNYHGQYGWVEQPSTQLLKVKLDDVELVASEVAQIAAGHGFSFILMKDGSLWACGTGTDGQLGNGSFTNENEWVQITNYTDDIKQVVCGYDFTFLLKNNGTLWATGNNQNGQLGLGDTYNKYTFTQVINENIGEIEKVACGYDHTYLLMKDGTLLAAGCNATGELGLGNTDDLSNVFVQVGPTGDANKITDVADVICGGCFTYIIKTDGSIWSCGSGDCGQLGDNNSGYDHWVSTFDEVFGFDSGSVKKIVCGNCHVLVLLNDGTLWGTGDNSIGQLGLGTNTENAVKLTQIKNTTDTVDLKDVENVFCSGYSSYIMRSDGSLWSTGNNESGELTLSPTDTDTRFIFEKIPLDTYFTDQA